MGLQAEYREALIMLCYKVLRWFVNAFSGGGLFTSSSGFAVSSKLWTRIKEMDRACQKFKITVDMPDDDPKSKMDVEDVLDEVIET